MPRRYYVHMFSQMESMLHTKMVVRFSLFVKALVCVTGGHQLYVPVLWSWNIWRFWYLFILMMIEIISWHYIFVLDVWFMESRQFCQLSMTGSRQMFDFNPQRLDSFYGGDFCFSRVDLSKCESAFCPAVEKRNSLLIEVSLRQPGENRERETSAIREEIENPQRVLI